MRKDKDSANSLKGQLFQDQALKTSQEKKEKTAPNKDSVLK